MKKPSPKVIYHLVMGLTYMKNNFIIEFMEERMKRDWGGSHKPFSLPRYEQLPNMGLYLEQTVKYLNQSLEQFGCIQVTGSMVRNYVKMGLVKNPIKRAYYADQIGHLMVITILKTVMPLENLRTMINSQKKVYSDEVAFDYFCSELENVLNYQFGYKTQFDAVGESESLIKTMLRTSTIAVSEIIYLNACFEWLRENGEEINN